MDESGDPPDGESGRARPGLKVVWSDAYEAEIGPHVFPTAKYRLLLETLLEEGTIAGEDVLEPEPATDGQLALVHTREYLRKIREDAFTLTERWRLEVPLTDEFRRASRICAGGSVLTGREALEDGVALHLGGGFHHAFPDHGEGFCLLNDVAVGLRVLLEEELVGRAAVVDCDVHQGNGTAAVFRDEPRVFTFSLHQERNYPAHKPPSDLDIGLADRADDREYLDRLDEGLTRVLETQEPELIYYLAGADPFRHDQLGGLALTVEGLRARDDLVLERATGAGAAVAVTLAGGYARRLEDTVEIHANTARAAAAARAGVAA